MMEKADLKPCPFCGCEEIEVAHDIHGAFWCYCPACWSRTGTYDQASGYTLAIEAWNRRHEQEEPDFYLCVESFLLPNIGEEGELLETQSKILKGTMWSKEKSEYRFCSTSDSVRLENSERWIEISSDSFSKYFTPVWRKK